MFGGMTGVWTAMKAGAFSLSVNERHLYEGPRQWLINFSLIFLGFPEISWIIRDAFLECEDFACAESLLSYAYVISPSYLTLAGTKNNDGVVITRDRWGVAHFDRLNETRWYVLQTNDDTWTGVCQERCQVGNANM